MSNLIVKVWSGDGYTLQVEDVNGDFYLHCEISKNTPRVFKDLYSLIYGELCSFAIESGKDALYSLSPNGKFIKVMAPEAYCIFGKDGLEVYKWEL